MLQRAKTEKYALERCKTRISIALEDRGCEGVRLVASR
jgi:hypothetical protein